MASCDRTCCMTPDLTVCTSGACCGTSTDFTPAIAQVASDTAKMVLWALTGRRFSLCCPITVRPCKPETCKPNSVQDIIWWEANRTRDGVSGAGNLGVLSFTPTLIDGSVLNIGCGCPVACCTCKADCEVYLPGPVCEVTHVVVDGVDVGQNLWYMLDHEKLVFRNAGTTVIVPTPGPNTPSPLVKDNPDPTSQANGEFGPSMSLDTIGAAYEFTTPNANDIAFIVEIPVGNGPTDFDVFQPQGFDATVLSGAPFTFVHAPNTSNVAVGFATHPDPLRVLIRAPRGWNSNDITIKQNSGANPIRLVQVQWSDLTTTECGVRRWTEATSDPTKSVCCNFPTSSYTDVGNGGLHCFDQPAAGTCNIPAGTWLVTAGGDTSPYNGTMLVSFSDGQKLFEQAGAFNCGDFGEVAPPISRSGIFTFAAPVTATLFFEQDNGEGVAHPITNPFVCYEPQIAAHFAVVSTSCCPPCQDYNKPNGEVGTWSVTYTYGQHWPSGAEQMAGLLACEIGNALSGNTSGLPADVVTLARQGISIELPNLFDLIKFRLTGIRTVDLWIMATNPGGLTQRARVWSPDLPITRRETS